MKYGSIVIVFVVLLAFGAFSISAQETGCEIDLASAISSLAQAQVLADSGNSADALKAVTQAREALTAIEAACGLETPAISAGENTSQTSIDGVMPLPPPSRGSAAILYGSSTFDRLKGVAFVNGIDLRIIQDHYKFLQAIQEPDIGVVIYAVSNGRTDSASVQQYLLAIKTFVEDGGRAFIYFDRDFTQLNDTLQADFGMSVVDEQVMKAESPFIYEPDMLPSWLQGLEIGIEESYMSVGLSAYLLTPQAGSESRYMLSETAQDKRLMYYSNSDGSIIFFPATVDGNSALTPFFDDDNLEFFDNEAAALAMLNYLLGR